jgi:hypothetical protein
MTREEHKKLGISYFNKTWSLIEMENRTKEEDMEMIHYSHASRLHWELSEPPLLNIVRGEWLVSHVYSLLKMGKSALFHAQFVYDRTIENNYTDFDLVFAFESIAFAYKVLDNIPLMHEYLARGYEAIELIQKREDKEYCKSQLDIIINTVANEK